MSRWAKILQNGWFSRVATECYNKKFPVEIRARLSDWLEFKEPWILSVDPANPSNQSGIIQFLQEMFSAIDQLPINLPPVNMSSQYSIIHRHIVETAYRQLLETLRTNVTYSPYDLFRDIKESLMKENKLLNELINLQTGHGGNFTSATAATISEKEQFMRVDQEMKRRLTQITGNFHKMEVAMRVINMQYLALENQDPSSSISQTWTGLHNLCDDALELFNPMIKDAFLEAKKELEKFHTEQLHVSVGKKKIRDLIKIDHWFEGIAKCLARLANLLFPLAHFCQLLNSDKYQSMTTLQEEIENMKGEMISLSLIIEQQPKLVIRNNTCFGHSVKLRLLKCSDNMSTIPGKLKLLNEKMRLDPAYKPEIPIGDVGNRQNTPPIVTSNTVEYRFLKVTEIDRSSELERGRDLVVQEKFYIQFDCKVNVDGKTYELSVVSLPLSITTHTNQEGSAWATILWRNAVDTMRNQGSAAPARPCLNPLSVNVTWSALIQWIDYMFQKLGKGLTDQNKTYLKRKLFRGNVPSHEMVSWQTFARDTHVEVPPQLLDNWKEAHDGNKGKAKVKPLPEPSNVPFTFWEWLYACLELLNWKSKDRRYADKTLKILWEQGRIEGFMTEDDIKHLLNNATNPGTFIIRFPEGRPKSIGTYVFDANGEFRRFTYTIKDLDKEPLHDIIMHNPLLNYLHPDEDKRDVFRKPFTRGIINGYVMPEFRQYISRIFLKAAPTEQRDQYASNPGSSGQSHDDTQSTQSSSSASAQFYSTTSPSGSRGESCNTSHSDYSATADPIQPEADFDFSALSIEGLYDAAEAAAAEMMNWTDGVETPMSNM